MKPPRFRIRSLLIVVVIVALILGIVLVSLENARLRRELARTAVTNTNFLNALLAATQSRVKQVVLFADAGKPTTVAGSVDRDGDMMPNSSEAFTTPAGQPKTQP